MIPHHVAVGVVVALEVIDIEHDQAQRARLPGAAPELDVQRPLEQSAVGQSGQAVVGGDQLQRLLCPAQIRLDPLANTHLMQEHPPEQPHAQQYQGNNETGAKRRVVPARENGFRGRRRRDHQRIRLQLSVTVKACHTIDDGCEHRIAGAGQWQGLLENLALGQRRADLRLHKRSTRQQRAIGQAEKHRAVVVEAEAFEELVEVRHLDPGQQYALETAVLVVDPFGNRNDPLTVFPTANGRADMRHRRYVLLVILEVLAIGDAGPPRQIFKRGHHPLALLVEQQDAVQLIQRQHAPSEGLLQAWPLVRAEPVDLNPVHQAGQHQVGLHEGVFGLLRHGPRQVRRRHLRQAQVVATGLFQLQVEQTAQAQAHRGNEQYRGLAQWYAFQCDARGVVRVVKARGQKFILSGARHGQRPKALSLRAA
ncbi:hypothetical protein D3C73_888330 [compost metagenome]